jgi:hypothetical protein
MELFCKTFTVIIVSGPTGGAGSEGVAMMGEHTVGDDGD